MEQPLNSVRWHPMRSKLQSLSSVLAAVALAALLVAAELHSTGCSIDREGLGDPLALRGERFTCQMAISRGGAVLVIESTDPEFSGRLFSSCTDPDPALCPPECDLTGDGIRDRQDVIVDWRQWVRLRLEELAADPTSRFFDPTGESWCEVEGLTECEATGNLTPSDDACPPPVATPPIATCMLPPPRPEVPCVEVVEPADRRLVFAETCVGLTSPDRVITLRNCGDVPLTISVNDTVDRTSRNPDDFVISMNECRPTPGMIRRAEDRQLEPGETCTLLVSFAPRAPGRRSASITITTDDPAHPTIRIDLEGQALAGMLAVEPEEICFRRPALIIGCPPVASVTIRNIGCGTLTVTRFFIDNPNFEIVTPPVVPLVLAPGEARTLQLRFCSRDRETFTDDAELQITSDDPVSPTNSVTILNRTRCP